MVAKFKIVQTYDEIKAFICKWKTSASVHPLKAGMGIFSNQVTLHCY